MAWVPSKIIDFSNIKELMIPSFESNHFTNYGPLVRQLESHFQESFCLPNDKRVIVVNNGANALHAMINGMRLFHLKELIFTTQDFTFPSALQGSLTNSHVVDLDETYQFDLKQVRSDSDGLIVTNLFGNCCDIDKYVNFCKDKNKILIFDNATCPYTFYDGKNINSYGNGTIVSLHHTKPIGFGEGGLIVVDRLYEESIRSVLNFGYKDTGVRIWNAKGNNFKMSDVAAAFILEFQKNTPSIIEHHKNLYLYSISRLSTISNMKMFPTFSSDIPFVSCITIIHEGNSLQKIRLLNDNGIAARQYYPSLTGLYNSSNLFSHIICIPCTTDITIDILNKVFELLTL